MIVDLDMRGQALGIESTVPAQLTLVALNRLIRDLGCEPVRRIDIAPLLAASLSIRNHRRSRRGAALARDASWRRPLTRWVSSVRTIAV
jgi:hypothetical protein